jgi:hypothetical protein
MSSKHVIKKTPKKINDEQKEVLICDLIEALNTLGFTVRIEKGMFKGGFCMLKEQKVFLMNRNLEQDKKINILVKNISGIGIEDIYLKPNIRELIEKERGEDTLV